MLTRMQTGRFRVFSHLKDFWEEFHLYHRKNGLIVKETDDLMAAARYAVMMIRKARNADEVNTVHGTHRNLPVVKFEVFDPVAGY